MGKPEWTFWPTQYLHWLNNNGKGVGHGSQVFQVTEAAGSNPEAEISQADAENGKAMGHWHPGAERCGGRRPVTEGFPEQVKSRQYPGTLSITETQAAAECEMHHIPTKRWTIPLRYIQLLWYFNGFFLQTLFFRAILDSPRVHSSQLRFTLASVLSVCLDTCIMTCIYH